MEDIRFGYRNASGRRCTTRRRSATPNTGYHTIGGYFSRRPYGLKLYGSYGNYTLAGLDTTAHNVRDFDRLKIRVAILLQRFSLVSFIAIAASSQRGGRSHVTMPLRVLLARARGRL
jgi:hypothetical protein